MRTARRERALFLITISTSWSTAVQQVHQALDRETRELVVGASFVNWNNSM